MVAKRKGTKRQNILARQLKTDQQEPHRSKKKKSFQLRVKISEEIFNDEPILQGSGCKQRNQSIGHITVDDSKGER